MIVDAHIHVAPPNLPGVGVLHPALRSPQSAGEALRREMAAAGVEAALAMGSVTDSDDDPLGIAAILGLAREMPGLLAIGVADPRRADASHLRRVEAALAAGQVKALKAYLGYLHFGPDHAGYLAYFELAERYRLPVVFHTGDTYSPNARLRHAQPLLIDDVAVAFPNVRFIMAHFGNPWLTDAAAVVYKNTNVWADLSGLIVGDATAFTGEERADHLNDVREAVRRAFRYAERPNRFLYGSDWPLAPMRAYREFIAGAVPAPFHEQVFAENARLVFRLNA
jgi:predicted TIM-barrel fold metal-dependent hydrolase